jgi:lysophospholipase L1-like esterase
MLALSLLLLVSAHGGRAAAPSAAARLLPLGDSLTLGVQGQGGGYRSPLGVALKGYSTPYNVNFVGGLYLAGDHSGYSGHTISGVEGALRAARTMELTSPTHVLLLAGTNDFYFFPPLGADAETALVRLDSLMGFLTNSSLHAVPKVIFVATVPPVLVERCAAYSQGPCAPMIAVNIAEYNAKLPAAVAEWKARAGGAAGSGTDVQLVDLNKKMGVEPGDYWTAGIHFNDNGWCKMARVWFSAVAPTLLKRSSGAAEAVAQPSLQQSSQQAAAAAAAAAGGLFAVQPPPVPSTGQCKIVGSTAVEYDDDGGAGGARPQHAAQASAIIAAGQAKCTHVMTVNINATNSGQPPPSFAEFYGQVASALKLQFGPKGSFCSWAQLQPRCAPTGINSDSNAVSTLLTMIMSLVALRAAALTPSRRTPSTSTARSTTTAWCRRRRGRFSPCSRCWAPSCCPRQ